jgi:succinyl-CoA synthetase beta subunit
MARLFEYQGKELLKRAKVPIPEGEVATTPQEARKIAEKVGKSVAIKAQIWAGGRGKAGGIQFAQNPEEAEKAANKLLGAEIKNLTVEKVLVEEKLEIDREFYIGVIIDASREVRAPVVMFSTEGGVDIEEVPSEKIAQMNVDVLRGLRFYDGLNLAITLKVPTQLLPAIAQAILGLYETFKGYNCRTAEINPLVLTRDGKIYAADCRMAIDDSSVFRHPEMGIDVARESSTPPTELDKIAWQIEEGDLRGTCYIAQMIPEIKELGVVGYHGIGGGGAILGVDALNRQGLKIANYADTSGNPTAAKVYRAAKVILSQAGIEGYMLGGFIVANTDG